MALGEQGNMFWRMPSRIWSGRTVYIIGGGPSLEGFDWEPLQKERVIGCNDAYQLGQWVDVCCFGDLVWYTDFHQEQLQSFSGLICSFAADPSEVDSYAKRRVRWLKRNCTPNVLETRTQRIGWYGHTGASAINLAIQFGAKRIVLLGFDMKMKKDKGNWHTNRKNFSGMKDGQGPRPALYKRFTKGLVLLKAHVDAFGGIEILNAGPDSALEIWPKVELKEVLCQS